MHGKKSADVSSVLTRTNVEPAHIAAVQRRRVVVGARCERLGWRRLPVGCEKYGTDSCEEQGEMDISKTNGGRRWRGASRAMNKTHRFYGFPVARSSLHHSLMHLGSTCVAFCRFRLSELNVRSRSSSNCLDVAGLRATNCQLLSDAKSTALQLHGRGVSAVTLGLTPRAIASLCTQATCLRVIVKRRDGFKTRYVRNLVAWHKRAHASRPTRASQQAHSQTNVAKLFTDMPHDAKGFHPDSIILGKLLTTPFPERPLSSLEA